MQHNFTKEEAIMRIQSWIECGQEAHARVLYAMLNKAYPEWELKEAFEALRGNK